MGSLTDDSLRRHYPYATYSAGRGVGGVGRQNLYLMKHNCCKLPTLDASRWEAAILSRWERDRADNLLGFQGNHGALRRVVTTAWQLADNRILLDSAQRSRSHSSCLNRALCGSDDVFEWIVAALCVSPVGGRLSVSEKQQMAPPALRPVKKYTGFLEMISLSDSERFHCWNCLLAAPKKYTVVLLKMSGESLICRRMCFMLSHWWLVLIRGTIDRDYASNPHSSRKLGWCTGIYEIFLFSLSLSLCLFGQTLHRKELCLRLYSSCWTLRNLFLGLIKCKVQRLLSTRRNFRKRFTFLLQRKEVWPLGLAGLSLLHNWPRSLLRGCACEVKALRLSLNAAKIEIKKTTTDFAFSLCLCGLCVDIEAGWLLSSSSSPSTRLSIC